MMTQGRFQLLLLAVVLVIGFAVVWYMFCGWTVEAVASTNQTAFARESIECLADGTALVTKAGTWGPDGRAIDGIYQDLEGNPVEPPDDAQWLRGKSTLPAVLPSGLSCESARFRNFRDGRTPAIIWHFVADGRPHGTAYFVGYDSESNARIGYLGKNGFSAEFPAPEALLPFSGDTTGDQGRVFCLQGNFNYQPGYLPPPSPGSYSKPPIGGVAIWDVYVLGTDGKLYHANLQNKTVEVVLDEPRLLSMQFTAHPDDSVRGTPFWLAARLDDTVLVLDVRGNRLRNYPIPEALRGRDLGFAITTTDEALMTWQSPQDSLATEIEHWIYWVSTNGQYREAAAVLPCPAPQRRMQVLWGVVMPSPLLVDGFVIGMQRSGELMRNGFAATYGEAVSRALTEFWLALVIAHLVAAGFALLCYRRQVRYQSSRADRVIWPLFVLALGLPGWIAYRFGRTWPVLEACPACNEDAPRDREDCAHCEAEFPPPALKGTEVFA